MSVGGFDEAYVYGSEDWDLCLKLRRLGKMVVIGDSLLYHHEYGTQKTLAENAISQNRQSNHSYFAGRWGGWLFRRVIRDRLNHNGTFTYERAPAIAIVNARGLPEPYDLVVEALIHEFRQHAWEATVVVDPTERPASVDAILSLSPEFEPFPRSQSPICIAWIVHDGRSWRRSNRIEGYDLVLTADKALSSLLTNELGRRVETMPPPFYAVPDLDHERSGVGALARDRYQATAVDDLWTEIPGVKLTPYGEGWETAPSPPRSEVDQTTVGTQHRFWFEARTPQFVGPSPTLVQAAANGAVPITNSWDDAVSLFGDDSLFIPHPRSMAKILKSDDIDVNRPSVLSQHSPRARTSRLIDLMRDWAERPRIGLRICPHSAEVAPKWGDTYFARQFASALERRGATASVQIRPAWYLPANQAFDVIVHMRGVTPYNPQPGAINVLWIISHPAEVTPEECELYDLVLVASERHAKTLAQQCSVPVEVFHQATDTLRFAPSPAPEPDFSFPVAFIGNARWPYRNAPRWLLHAQVPFALIGANWDGFPEDRVRVAEFVANDRLPELYQSAGIIVNDHWGDMRSYGFVSNRLFDVLASGGFVVSDDVDGIDELFDGAVPTYNDATELIELISRFTENPDERHHLSRKGMKAVRKDHSFDTRAQQFFDLLQRKVGWDWDLPPAQPRPRVDPA